MDDQNIPRVLGVDNMEFLAFLKSMKITHISQAEEWAKKRNVEFSKNAKKLIRRKQENVIKSIVGRATSMEQIQERFKQQGFVIAPQIIGKLKNWISNNKDKIEHRNWKRNDPLLDTLKSSLELVPISQIVLAEFDQESFEKLVSIIEDPENMPASFAEWKFNSYRNGKEIRKLHNNVISVPFSVERFVKWCRDNKKSLNTKSKNQFIEINF